MSPKTLFPNLFTLVGITNIFNDEQLLKALSSKVVTPEGISKNFKKEHPQKAPAPILFTPTGIVYSSLFLPAGYARRFFLSFVKSAPTIEQYSGLFSETSIVVKEEQCTNELSPILVTLEGIATEDKEEQFSNALSPILVTPEGIAN